MTDTKDQWASLEAALEKVRHANGFDEIGRALCAYRDTISKAIAAARAKSVVGDDRAPVGYKPSSPLGPMPGEPKISANGHDMHAWSWCSVCDSNPCKCKADPTPTAAPSPDDLLANLTTKFERIQVFCNSHVDNGAVVSAVGEIARDALAEITFHATPAPSSLDTTLLDDPLRKLAMEIIEQDAKATFRGLVHPPIEHRRVTRLAVRYLELTAPDRLRSRPAVPTREDDGLADCYKEHLTELVNLQSEYKALNGGGFGWERRWEKALKMAMDVVRVDA